MEVTPPSIVGILDSGIGGLSVLREIHKLLPHHPTVYFADQYHLPYGPRPATELQAYVEEITRFLLHQGSRVIVLACNTASAAALQMLRAKFPETPFVGMEPAIKPAIETTQTGVVGVLSTRTTAEGVPYQRLLKRYATGVKIITLVASDLVWVAERQLQHTDEGRALIKSCLEPLIEADADEIVLACTHFPFLTEVIQEIAGNHIRLVDPSPAVARQVARVWPVDAAVSQGTNVYFTSGHAVEFEQMLKTLLNVEANVYSAYWSQDGRLSF